ncbi:MAG TPA: rhodanese-like domain-containing protein [Marinobacter sp.]|nr:rhodanese-like domain-containing protein [Marinobacter sp.]
MKTLLIVFFMVFGLIAHAFANDEALAVTPQQTFDLVQTQPDQMLFVDVRDPIEIMFIGVTDVAQANIPFMLADRNRFLDDKQRFAMDQNPEFAAQVEAALKARGLNKDALVITMCRSGSSRGKPSADFLLSQGFTNVKYIDHGFQGSGAKDGKKVGMRIVNGWQNDGLPWSMKLNPDKIYRTGQ